MPRLSSLSLCGDNAIDFRIYYELVLQIEDMDLTGATVIAQIRQATQSEIAATFAVTLDVQSPSLAELTFVLDEAAQLQTGRFKPGVYDWDVLVVFPSLPPQYLFGGKVVVNQRISHAA